MMRLIAWFARNSVAANLLMMLIIIMGWFSLGTLKHEIYPEAKSYLVQISVPYLGAAPQEVEEGVCIRIEEAIQDLDGIKKITSNAAEGVGVVFVEAEDEKGFRGDEEGDKARRLLEEIKARVDAIDTFPEETEKPLVQEVLLRTQVLNISIAGDADEITLKEMAERTRDDLLALPGVTQVEVAAARPYEISIEVSEQALRRWGLTFDQVVEAVRSSSLDLPGGSVKTDGGEILLRTKGQAYRGKEFESIVLLARRDGTRLYLGDVATVVDGFAETNQAARFDDKPAVVLQVFRVGEQSVRDVATQVKRYLEGARKRLPDGFEMTTWQDDSLVLESRIDLMVRNGQAGLILVLITLALFINLRLAFWVAAGIIISFMGALWLMPALGLSINLMSLLGFILVLGLVVDDAIVVSENVYRHRMGGLMGIDAAIKGTQEVAKPVIFSVLTTLAAFSPQMFGSGVSGKIVVAVPLVAVAALGFSLMESLLILPAHLAHLKVPQEEGGLLRFWSAVQRKITEVLEWIVETAYKPVLAWALQWRYLTVAIGLAVFFLTMGIIGIGWVNFVFFPDIESDNTVAYLTMPQGTPVNYTADALRELESAARELESQLEAEGHGSPFRHILTTIGEQPFRVRQAQALNYGYVAAESGSHLGEVNIELSPGEGRSFSGAEVVKRWRELTGAIPDAVELAFSNALLDSGAAINVELRAGELETLRQAAAELKERLHAYAGVFDVGDSFRPGKRELRIEITPEAEALGLTLSDVARQVRQGFYGEEAQRVQRGRDDIRVMVRYSQGERETLAGLESMRIRTPGGDEVPFSIAAQVVVDRGFESITRTDRKRTVNVTANIDPEKASANDVVADLDRNVLPALASGYPGLGYAFAGQQQEQRENTELAAQQWTIAFIVIFVLLALAFGSYIQPVIVMSAVPFGVIGATWGHAILGIDLTVLSIFGLVAMTGVVINDSLVMVDFINSSCRSGVALAEAIRTAGTTRFRPIILTSLTTFIGLTPLLFERSLQASTIIPMAASLAFGVLFATPITLVLVPVLYLIVEDLKAMTRTILGRTVVARDVKHQEV